jgi:large subunit ribosomal protein L15
VFGVNVSTLDENFENGTVITEELLRSVGIVNGRYDQVKILGMGDLTKSLTIQIGHVSATAREKIEKAGGTIQSA